MLLKQITVTHFIFYRRGRKTSSTISSFFLRSFKTGDVAAELSLQGLGISAEDLLIAATALQLDMTLVTANTKHFEIIPGLKLENWRR